MGNMYDWVTKTWNPLAGECMHKCPYCYMNGMRRRWRNPKWLGVPRLDERAIRQRFKGGDVVFVQNASDLFAENVPDVCIGAVLGVTRKFPETRFVWQSRSVCSMYEFRDMMNWQNDFVGTTIETNRDVGCLAGNVLWRAIHLRHFMYVNFTTFVTIEPILKFDFERMMELIKIANPSFVNIGADSKGGAGLEEPTKDEVLELVGAIEGIGIEVRRKRNLERILNQ